MTILIISPHFQWLPTQLLKLVRKDVGSTNVSKKIRMTYIWTMLCSISFFLLLSILQCHHIKKGMSCRLLPTSDLVVARSLQMTCQNYKRCSVRGLHPTVQRGAQCLSWSPAGRKAALSSSLLRTDLCSSSRSPCEHRHAASRTQACLSSQDL